MFFHAVVYGKYPGDVYHGRISESDCPDRRQWRRRGIGQMLLTDLLGKAAGRNVKRIFLEVRVSNEAALALYSQAGFQIIDKRKNYYEKPKEDAYIMVWDKL